MRRVSRARARAGALSRLFRSQGLDTDSPTLRLGDGTEFAGTWEEVVGTCVVFTEEEGQQEGDTRRVRHAGHCEVKLVLRRK